MHDPNWVAPILLERKFHFDSRHNPFFRHAEAEFWIAIRNGKPVGRITAQIDHLHLARYQDATGHFGFLEAIDDHAVFAALIKTAEDWLRAKGMKRVYGPVSFSMWDQPGLLVEGFDHPPYVLMGHALPYYARYIEAEGYSKVEDLLAYEYTRDRTIPPVVDRIISRAMHENDFVLRKLRLDRKHVKDEVRLILDILNDGWSTNWGFVPMTEAEIEDLAAILQLLVNPKDGVIAEYNGKAAAFALTLPNLNEAARDLDGKLFPFGIFKLLWRVKVKGTRTARMALMGVRKTAQNSPVGAALALAVIKRVHDYHYDRGATEGELSWVLERNERVRHLIELTGIKPYKRYRIYEKSLT